LAAAKRVWVSLLEQERVRLEHGLRLLTEFIDDALPPPTTPRGSSDTAGGDVGGGGVGEELKRMMEARRPVGTSKGTKLEPVAEAGAETDDDAEKDAREGRAEHGNAGEDDGDDGANVDSSLVEAAVGMRHFAAEAAVALSALELVIRETKRRYAQLLTYFCEDPTFDAPEFFAAVEAFLVAFASGRDRLYMRQKQEARQQQQQQQQQTRTKKKQPVLKSPSRVSRHI